MPNATDTTEGDGALPSALPSAEELHKRVTDDIADRGAWAEQQAANRTARFAKTATRLPQYAGAPNIAEPLIDDLIRETVTVEIGVVWGSKRLATFLPLDQQSQSLAQAAEQAFDFHLRAVGGVRAKLEQALDARRERGMSIAKLVENADNQHSFEVVDPLNVVVPTGTASLKDAERVAHIQRLTKYEFEGLAKRMGWDQAAVAAALAKANEAENGTSSPSSKQTNQATSDGTPRSAYKDDALGDSVGKVTVIELYHTDDAGQRKVTVYAKDIPATPLAHFSWVDEPVVTTVKAVDPLSGAEVSKTVVEAGGQRVWPFVQFRNEDRAVGFYDTRGDAERIKTDQQEAGAYRTLRAIAMDFAGKPFLRGAGKAVNFKFRPGEDLGEKELVYLQAPLGDFTYQEDFARAKASRRVGSAAGAFSSMDTKRQTKTATEVGTQSNLASAASTNSIERFAEPLGELFAEIWRLTARRKRATGKDGLLQTPQLTAVDFWQGKYRVSCGVSGRTANALMNLAQLRVAADLAGSFPQLSQFVRGRELAEYAFNAIDPLLGEKVVVSADQQGQGGGAPIEQMMKQLMQQVQAQGAYLAEIAKHDVDGLGQGSGDGGQQQQPPLQIPDGGRV